MDCSETYVILAVSAKFFRVVVENEVLGAIDLGRGEEISICVLCVILFGAGWTDFHCGKIRNAWLCAGILLGVVLEGLRFIPAALLLMVPSYFLYRMRMMGAGDGKLMALIAGYLGIDAGLKSIGLGLLFGAVWSACRLWRTKNFQLRLTYLTAYIWQMIHLRKITEYENLSAGNKEYTIPLAVCLVAGVYVYLIFSGMTSVGRGFF